MRFSGGTGYVLARISHGSRHHRTGRPKNSPLALLDAVVGMDICAEAIASPEDLPKKASKDLNPSKAML
jgi:hypothetical protein